jgi:hypothetical protein
MPSLRHWSSQLAWFPVFLTSNAVVFWLSMQSVAKQAFIETLGDWVVAGQIAVMAIAGSFVAQWDFSAPTRPVVGNKVRWVFATVLLARGNARCGRRARRS